MFANSALIGFGQGFQPVCGFNYGAGKYKRVLEAFWFCVKYAFLFLIVVGITGFIFAPGLVSLFRDDLEEGMKIRVVREGSMITAVTDGDGDYCIYLHNVRRALSPDSQIEQQEFGVKIIPGAGQKLCTIIIPSDHQL